MDERGVITVHGPFQGLDRFEARSAIVAALRERGPDRRREAPVRPLGRPLLALQDDASSRGCRCSGGSRSSRSPRPPVTRSATAGSRSTRRTCRSGTSTGSTTSTTGASRASCGGATAFRSGTARTARSSASAPTSEPPTGEGWTQDTDVLDTWFSSGLWPFSTLGWPEQTPDLEKFYPTDVLLTGHDIIFFWVARMMMFGLYAMDGEVAVPHHRVPPAWSATSSARRCRSPSATTVDPLDWMDTYGSDAVRFTLAKGANPGTDVPIGEDWVQASRNFANKIWNATRFALMNGATIEGELPPVEQLSATDRWILSRLNETVAEVDAYYDDYQFAKLADALYHFAWDEVFDWYVELSKTTFFAGGEQAKVSGRVLGEVLDVMLRLLHPVVPFVTETLWTTLTGGESLVDRRLADGQRLPRRGRRGGDRARSSRSSPRSAASAPTRACSPARRSRPASTCRRHALAAARGGHPPAAASPAGGRRLQRHRDPPGRRRHGRPRPVRHDRRRGRAQAPRQGPGRRREGEGRRPTAKLGNEAFLAKAPDNVVDKIRARLAKAEEDIAAHPGAAGAVAFGVGMMPGAGPSGWPTVSGALRPRAAVRA